MLPTSHRVPIVTPPAAAEGALAEVFDTFIATASRMEISYGQLQGEVAQLRRELEERNAALESSLAETQTVRTALHRILEALPCGVIVIDQKSHVIGLMNPEAKRLSGISNPDFKALPTRIQEVLTSAVSSNDEFEFSLQTESGNRWLAVRRSAGSKDQTILILRDITSQKEIERQRESSRNMLALGEMSAVLAHEVRNPLSSMELWTGLLAKQPDNDEETKYWIENLQAGVRTLSATVNNVLQFHGRGTGNQVRLKLATVLQNGYAFISPLAEQAGIKLTLNPGPKEIEISGDPNGLQQVILNLAINAFRHTAIGGSVTISVHLKEDLSGVVLEFTDSGKGISEANLPRLFEAGFSGSGQTPGLGLAVCKRIVEQHQGTIAVESQLGKGTKFTLEFPIL
ncbi:MAG TPA: ATP-binding protein [Terriglobales bacterium]|jgi:two-component system sensor histidine kinase FlrB